MGGDWILDKPNTEAEFTIIFENNEKYVGKVDEGLRPNDKEGKKIYQGDKERPIHYQHGMPVDDIRIDTISHFDQELDKLRQQLKKKKKERDEKINARVRHSLPEEEVAKILNNERISVGQDKQVFDQIKKIYTDEIFMLEQDINRLTKEEPVYFRTDPEYPQSEKKNSNRKRVKTQIPSRRRNGENTTEKYFLWCTPR